MTIERRLTPVPLAGLQEALDAAHRGLRGTSLGDDAYALVEAMLRLEHGVANGSLRGVWWYNLGNHDASPAELRDASIDIFATVPEREVGGGGREYQAVHHRVAYRCLDDGLRGYWRTLIDGYPEAYEELEAREVDAGRFAAALKARHYYTASVESYGHALRAIVAELTPTLPTGS